jgi:hypothetical protein
MMEESKLSSYGFSSKNQYILRDNNNRSDESFIEYKHGDRVRNPSWVPSQAPGYGSIHKKYLDLPHSNLIEIIEIQNLAQNASSKQVQLEEIQKANKPRINLDQCIHFPCNCFKK